MTKYTLENIISGPLDKPFRLFIYGAPGIGKSTFASEAPSPIFLGAEGGTSRLDVKRLPEPDKWEDVFEAIDLLINSKHEYKTLVIDPVNWIEPICDDYVCRKNKQDGKLLKDIDEFGYGRGHALVRDEWRRLLNFLEQILDKGMNIILIAHSRIKTFSNPTGPDFDRYRPDMNNRSADLLMQWAEDVLFVEYETATYEKKGRVRGIDTGKRIMHTVESAGWCAKNRCNIPSVLALSWTSYADAVGLGNPAKAEDILAEIKELIPYIEDKEQLDKIKVAVAQSKDNAVVLSRYLNKIRILANKPKNEGDE